MTAAGNSTKQVVALVCGSSGRTFMNIHPLLQRFLFFVCEDRREDARYFNEILRKVSFLLVSSVDHEALDYRITEDLLDRRRDPVFGLSSHSPIIEVVGDSFEPKVLF